MEESSSDLMITESFENNGSSFNVNSNLNILSGLSLKHQVMLNQFVSITGCSFEQSLNLLTSTNWHYQNALSKFFDGITIQIPILASQALTHSHLASSHTVNFSNHHQSNFSSNQSSQANISKPQSGYNINSSSNLVSFSNLAQICAPSNTPVTPPNLEYLEKAFSKLNPSLNTPVPSSFITSSHINNTNLPLINQNINFNTNGGNQINNNNDNHSSGNIVNSKNFDSIQKSKPIPINSSINLLHVKNNKKF